MRRRWRYLLSGIAVVAGLLALLAGWLFWAAQHVPEFYQARLTAAPEQQAVASEELLAQAAALASQVRKAGKWEAVFSEDQLNGWLAVDLPTNHPTLLPPEIREPRVALEPALVRVAWQMQSSGLQAVVSLDLELSLEEPNVLAIRIREAQAGRVPFPIAPFQEELANALRKGRVRLRWVEVEGDPVALVELPPRDDGELVYRLEAIEVQEGKIYFAGTTEPSSPADEAPPAVAGDAPEASHQPPQQGFPQAPRVGNHASLKLKLQR